MTTKKEPITITIDLFDEVGSKRCMLCEDGDKLYNLISKTFHEGDKVELSFRDVSAISSNFLNSAVGKLYKDFSKEEIENNLTFTHIGKIGRKQIRIVKENAIQWYNRPPNWAQREGEKLLNGWTTENG